MKKLIVGLFALGSISSFASVTDIGVIGPAGEVILYYKEGESIIVKACEQNTILGSTPIEARNNCQGKSNKVPVESFKQTIRNLVSIDRLNALKPLSKEEAEAYSRDDLSPEQIEAMVIELEKINHFITTYGAENANIVRKEELIKALQSQQTRVIALKKIIIEIEKTVNLIVDQMKLTLTKSNLDKDQFLYTVLKNFDPNQKFPCGLKGSIAERIKDCSYQITSQKEGFVLVTRSKEFKEVHKEIATGLLWSDRLPSQMNLYSAEYVCNSNLSEVAGIKELTWRLPSIDEYKSAEKIGIRKVLPNMNYSFWSSTLDHYSPSYAWKFMGQDGQLYQDLGKAFNSVRCVAL